MSANLNERMLALAGLMQAINQVQHIARHGNLDKQQLQDVLAPILVMNPDSTNDVYPSEPMITQGFKSIVQLFGSASNKDMEGSRFLVGILALERKLSKNPQALSMLGQRINEVNRQLNHFELSDDAVIANLASIYVDVISPLGPKLQVSGNPLHLQKPDCQNMIRACLLSAMRSAVLWRQLGGKRRQLIFSRQGILEFAQNKLR
ncbi:high frequency lysogenization protein HflD [Paraferrimonas sp. SM1919]|uniref:high frequency lysogenization protein HflD n=1 Tax=Paraferrimonas sp. SM1919 TaxID=2662263 RepID=UPI0013CFEFBA|nr:high frequency lysogenization protein HflD [Paraferrimonas sp. SM1919]